MRLSPNTDMAIVTDGYSLIYRNAGRLVELTVRGADLRGQSMGKDSAMITMPRSVMTVLATAHLRREAAAGKRQRRRTLVGRGG